MRVLVRSRVSRAYLFPFHTAFFLFPYLLSDLSVYPIHFLLISFDTIVVSHSLFTCVLPGKLLVFPSYHYIHCPFRVGGGGGPRGGGKKRGGGGAPSGMRLEVDSGPLTESHIKHSRRDDMGVAPRAGLF